MLELPGEISVAFTHLAAVGLASIVEDRGGAPATLSWTPALDSRPVIGGPDLDWDRAAVAVRDHAIAHADSGDWTAATVPWGEAGLFSPRIKPPADAGAWRALAQARRLEVDRVVSGARRLDLSLIGALGEPAYWRYDDSAGRSGHDEASRRPDQGASRWEMKTRNRGEDIIAHRLRRVAIAVAGRRLETVRDGLSGRVVIDEAGSDSVDSRSATGLAEPGPVDNALAWCALWGISSLPVIPIVGAPSRTAGHVPGRRSRGQVEFFYLPVPLRPILLARYRHVALSGQLEAVAVGSRDGGDSPETEASRAWLAARQIGAVVRFPVGVFGSASAPERRAMRGTVEPLMR